MAAVESRQNSVPDGQRGQEVLALIPGWDLSNHSQGKVSEIDVVHVFRETSHSFPSPTWIGWNQITTYYETSKDCLECTAMRSFAAGEQVRKFFVRIYFVI